MIDFRYHLISLVAVFFALGIGILMGSSVLDDRILSQVQDRVTELQKDKGDLRRQVDQLDRQLDGANAFAAALEQQLIDGVLLGQRVVLFEFDGTDGGAVDGIRDEVVEAGGEVVTTISISDRFRLDDDTERDELALILRSSLTDPSDLLAEAGVKLGARSAAAATRNSRSPESSSVTRLLQALVTDLEEAGFIGVDRHLEEVTIPAGGAFLIVGGSSEDRLFDNSGFFREMVAGMAQQGAAVLVAEPSTSSWGLVQLVRDDSELRNEVATVDQAETIAGRIAVVLGLDIAVDGVAGQYGTGPDATEVIPQPAAAP